jgi:hypothetical protein
MALYPPPRENVPIFDSFNFEINNTALTVDTGLEYFLAFPQAQGEQTMDDTNIAGTLTAFGAANFTSTVEGSLTSSATQPLPNDNTTKIPTTAWVQTAIATGGVAETLEEILQSGNSAGIYDIDMNNNDIINIKDLDVDGAADFNSTVSIDGVLTTTNAINMTGTSTALNNISTRQLSLKDAGNGNSNGSSILTNGNVLTVDSVGPNATNTSINFALRNTANAVVTPLQLTTTINNMNVPLDMTGANSTLSTIKSRVYNFKDISTGAATTSRIYLDNLEIAIENTQLNSSIVFETTTSGNVSVFPLSLGNTINNMNVALDMINTGSYFDASVRARYFTLRDLVSSAITSSGMYFSSNILQIDSDSDGVTDTAMYLRTRKPSGTLTNALQLTNTTVKTDCYNITTLPLTDNSNTIPTTTWVKNVLTSSSYLSPSTIRRASATGNFTGASGPNQIFEINLTGTGTSGIWALNQGVTFRVNYFQSFNPRPSGTPFDSQNYISYSGMLTLYPYRFSLSWLAAVVSGGPRGRVSDNVIVTSDGNSNTNYVVQEATTTPNGRQFWSNDMSFQSNGSFAGRLFVYGSAVSTNAVFFELSKPNGYSAATQTYNYNFSIELINQSNLSSVITSTGFNISNL